MKEVEKEKPKKKKEENTMTPVKQKILKWEVAMKGQRVIVAKKAGKVIGKANVTTMRSKGVTTGKGKERKEEKKGEDSARKIAQQQNITKYLQKKVDQGLQGALLRRNWQPQRSLTKD